MMMQLVDPRVAVLNVAKSLVWVRETQGSNRGEMVDRMIRQCGLEPPQPWCMAYVNWVGKAALDLVWPLPMSAGCQWIFEWAVKHRPETVRTDPAPGAIFLLWGEKVNRFRHTGFLHRSDDVAGFWRCYEGNTNEGGSPEGTGVFKRSRSFGARDRFIHFWL